MGEKFVQVAKRHFNSFRKNWHLNLIKRVVKYHTLSILSGSDIESYDLPREEECQHNYQNKMMSVHTYQCTHTPRRDLLCNKPIVFLQLQDDEFAISVSLNLYIKLTVESYAKNVCGLHYFRWKMEENINEGELQIKRS